MSKADGKDSVEEKNELLRQSVEKEDFEEFKRLLKEGAQLWPPYRSRESCLHIAVSKENMEFVKFILQHFVRYSRRNNTTFRRIDEGENYSREYMKECNLTEEEYMRDCGPSAIQLAAEVNNTEIVKGILDAGGMADAGDDYYSPLFWAVLRKNHEMINMLLKAGADQDRPCGLYSTWDDEKSAKNSSSARVESKRDKKRKSNFIFWPKETPFFLSLRRGWEEEYKILLQYREAEFCNIGTSGGSALYYAVMLKNRRAVKDLLKMGASPVGRYEDSGYYVNDNEVIERWSVLQLAIIKGDREIFKDILYHTLHPVERTTPPVVEDPIQREHFLKKLENIDPTTFDQLGKAKRYNKENIEELYPGILSRIHRGNVSDGINYSEPEHGYTALHLAVYLGNVTFVKELLNAKADVRIQTFKEEEAPKEGHYPCYADTPLTLAIRMLTGQLKYPMDEHKYQKAYQALQEGASKNDVAALPPYDEWYADIHKGNKKYNTEREKKGQDDFVKNLLEIIRELVKVEKDCPPTEFVLQRVRSLEPVKEKKKAYHDAWKCCQCLLRPKGQSFSP